MQARGFADELLCMSERGFEPLYSTRGNGRLRDSSQTVFASIARQTCAWPCARTAATVKESIRPTEASTGPHKGVKTAQLRLRPTILYFQTFVALTKHFVYRFLL